MPTIIRSCYQCIGLIFEITNLLTGRLQVQGA